MFRVFNRAFLLGTTALAVVFGIRGAEAADLRAVPVPAVPVMSLPAVDGINGAFALFGGGADQGGLFGGTGSLAVPLGHAFGTQIDLTAVSLDGNAYFSGADHLFWRDPTRGLVGLYGSYQHYDAAQGTHAWRAGFEAEAYMDRFTIRGVAGVERGKRDTFFNSSALTTTSFDLKTRFFDMIDLAYYPTDNLSLFVGHRYTAGEHALALGGEFLVSNRGGMAVSAFAEGRVGEDSAAVWGGVKLRFGQSEKTLIRRDREDDPKSWDVDTLFGIANSLGTTPSVTPFDPEDPEILG